eukprot:TRINITY_DN65458_c0_g1_i1.p1 TRINITY_DN65458_c0_g1~~TRINITY_DN65458_c0_g1_i1.p1  ORF type:complete len:569 (+),score=102.05 TRINITY_DN65458_c0_g1_i1:100-1806(+)
MASRLVLCLAAVILPSCSALPKSPTETLQQSRLESLRYANVKEIELRQDVLRDWRLHKFAPNETYCDSISCDHAPRFVGDVEMASVALYWGAKMRPKSLEGLTSARSVLRSFGSRQWRCNPTEHGVYVNWDILSQPEAAMNYMMPLRLLKFSDWQMSADSQTVKELAKLSVADHFVFGNYGGHWTMLTMKSPQAFATEGAQAADASRNVCANLVQALGQVEDWADQKSSRLRQQFANALNGMLVALKALSAAGSWGLYTGCIAWALSVIGAIWKGGPAKKLSADDGAQGSSLADEFPEPCRKAIWGTHNLRLARQEEAMKRIHAALSSCALTPEFIAELRPAWQVFAGDAWKERNGRSTADAPGSKLFRQCGAAGSVSTHPVGRGNTFEARILGASGWQPQEKEQDQAAEDRSSGNVALSSWIVEVSLFVRPSGCILVDGQRLFQTHPQSYLAGWRCVAQEAAAGKRHASVSHGVVSFSGTVSIITCKFSSALPTQPFELSLEATDPLLKAAGWHIEGLTLCPWTPLKPLATSCRSQQPQKLRSESAVGKKTDSVQSSALRSFQPIFS